MIYVVLGMHKSGTTLISQLLHFSGVNMGKFDLDKTYDRGNHFERKETLEVNFDLLNSRGKSSIETVVWVPSSRNHQDESCKLEATRIIEEKNGIYEDWGFKDPRTCLTYEFWRPLLPVHKIIAVYRNPYQVLNHYKSAMHRNRWKVLKSWEVYNRRILEILSKAPRDNYLVMNFEDLMSSDEYLRQLEDFTGKKIKDVRNKSLFRYRTEKDAVKLVDRIALSLTGSNIETLMDELKQLED